MRCLDEESFYSLYFLFLPQLETQLDDDSLEVTVFEGEKKKGLNF